MTSDIAREVERLSEDFGMDKKRSIGDVAQELGVEPHVIRFWEEQFPQIKPELGKGGRRYFYNKQVKVLKRIKKFLHDEGYTIAGLQKLLKKRKQDSHKEEDLDIIITSSFNENAAEQGVSDFINAINDEKQAANNNYAPKTIDTMVAEQAPSANIVANIGQVTNINKAPEHCLSKENREELSSLFKNITKNLGDLKMLLRS